MKKKILKELIRSISKLVHCMRVMDSMIERNRLQYTVRDSVYIAETIKLVEMSQSKLERILE